MHWTLFISNICFLQLISLVVSYSVPDISHMPQCTIHFYLHIDNIPVILPRGHIEVQRAFDGFIYTESLQMHSDLLYCLLCFVSKKAPPLSPSHHDRWHRFSLRAITWRNIVPVNHVQSVGLSSDSHTLNGAMISFHYGIFQWPIGATKQLSHCPTITQIFYFLRMK